MSDLVWGHASSPNAERYTGAFESREEAIEDGREWYGEAEVFWILGGTFPKVASFLPDPDYLLELMSEKAGDEHGEASEGFPDVSAEGKAALVAALAGWAKEHVEVRFWRSETEPERIDPLGS